MKLKSIFSSILAVALLVGLTTSCEDELQPQKQDVVKIMKTEITEGNILINAPDKIYTETEGNVIVVSGCEDVQLWKVPAGADCEEAPDEEAGWVLLGTFECDGDPLQESLYFEDEEVGVHTYKAILVDDLECDCDGDQLTEFVPEEICFDIQVCREETAFGGETIPDGLKKSWMYVYEADPDTEYDESLEENVLVGYFSEAVFADGGSLDDLTQVGDVVLNLEGTTLTITLFPCWHLLGDDEEPVKVLWYAEGETPDMRPKGKDFLQKEYSVEDQVITVDVSAAEGALNFVIHLSVETCELCIE